MKQLLRRFVPAPLLNVLKRFRRAVIYHNYDSSLYWRDRAVNDESSKVLWKNEGYNRLYRLEQRTIIKPFLTALKNDPLVLDIGCGIGVVARMLVELRSDVSVDAVDFAEMIAVAQKENPSNRITYISSSAEEYRDPGKKYDFIISSACFSAIRDIAKLEEAIGNSVSMLAEGGTILMIDPFHRWNYLARAKYNSRQVINLMQGLNCELTHQSGVLFWPYRDWLANSSLNGEQLEHRFKQGERLLSIMGKHYWADYKILAFRKRVSS